MESRRGFPSFLKSMPGQHVSKAMGANPGCRRTAYYKTALRVTDGVIFTYSPQTVSSNVPVPFEHSARSI